MRRLKRFLSWLGWRWDVFWLRSHIDDCAECGMGYSIGHQSSCEVLYEMETTGIEEGWMTEDTRTVWRRDT